jgi:hypothetical protein
MAMVTIRGPGRTGGQHDGAVERATAGAPATAIVVRSAAF